eukprot:m.55202 g.55202  ORF g.55202 m.55202 type:complete len:82 (+) comp22033_c0_seq1:246-491(+)
MECSECSVLKKGGGGPEESRLSSNTTYVVTCEYPSRIYTWYRNFSLISMLSGVFLQIFVKNTLTNLHMSCPRDFAASMTSA